MNTSNSSRWQLELRVKNGYHRKVMFSSRLGGSDTFHHNETNLKCCSMLPFWREKSMDWDPKYIIAMKEIVVFTFDIQTSNYINVFWNYIFVSKLVVCVCDNVTSFGVKVEVFLSNRANWVKFVYFNKQLKCVWYINICSWNTPNIQTMPLNTITPQIIIF